MAEGTETAPIFVDVGTQEQYAIEQNSFSVFTHINKPLEPVKEEGLTQSIPSSTNMQVLGNSQIGYEFPVMQDSLKGACTTQSVEDTGAQAIVTSTNTDFPSHVFTEQPQEAQCSMDIQEEETGPQTVYTEANAKANVNNRYSCTEMTDNVPCPYFTSIEDRLIRHIRKVHKGENPFQCTMCDYSTYNKAIFEEHVRIHQGIKPFKCRYCTYRSASKKNAKKHELIHRPDNPLKCAQCDFIARHERSLQVHMQTHTGSIQCPQCDYKADNAQSLRMHRTREHTRKQEPKYKCDRCDTKFVELRNLNIHKRKGRLCVECDTILCSKLDYNSHMVLVHQKSTEGDDLFVCAVCLWSSTNKVRILLHLIHHPNQKVDENLVDITILRNYGIMQ
ncbi:hypothetical protein evm_008176 [Chilo suppressalis]|nr:hypothetical protein evm_008176 [Chilo suppressalis]